MHAYLVVFEFYVWTDNIHREELIVTLVLMVCLVFIHRSMLLRTGKVVEPMLCLALARSRLSRSTDLNDDVVIF